MANQDIIAIVGFDYLLAANYPYRLRVICHNEDDLDKVIAECSDPSNTCVFLGTESPE